MNKKQFPPDTLSQAKNMQDAWAKIDDQLSVGGLKISDLVMEINQIHQAEASVVSLENDLTNMRNTRDALYESTWDKVRRMRAVVKGAYGFDSPQYELVGGTRASERKSVRRTAAPLQ